MTSIVSRDSAQPVAFLLGHRLTYLGWASVTHFVRKHFSEPRRGAVLGHAGVVNEPWPAHVVQNDLLLTRVRNRVRYLFQRLLLMTMRS